MSSDMNHSNISGLLKAEKDTVEARLSALVDRFPDQPPVIQEAVSYCLLDGGKRLRPILCLWTHDLYRGSQRDACLDVACAIEALHTYSLIHDDLPCMDDDDIRRGKPSCHKKFGEAIAVLTGDALLTFCFEIIASLNDEWETPHHFVVDVLKVTARAAGAAGLIRGQVLDLEGENVDGDIQMVERIHRNKTAELIACAMETGAIMAGADAEHRKVVRKSGILAGHAFQVIDDVLDREGKEETLGKTAGKDHAMGKLTYPSVAGVDAARQRAQEFIKEAKTSLITAGDSPQLNALFDLFIERVS